MRKASHRPLPQAVQAATPPERTPSTTTLVEPPHAATQPGHASVLPGLPPVPAPIDGPELVAWNNVLRNMRSAELMYRPAPSSDAGTELDLCAGCDVDCCTNHLVPLNLVDIARLAITLNMHPKEFVGVVDWQPQMPVQPLLWGSGKRALALRRHANQSCAFLVKLGPHRRCGVHGVRPDACRVFPFVHEATKQRLQPAGRLLQLHPSHCPWRWPVSEERRAQVLQDLEDNQNHREWERQQLGAWQGVPELETLWDFLGAMVAEAARS